MFVGTNVWFVGQSVRHFQGPFCVWRSWVGPCVLLELHWEFCGFLSSVVILGFRSGCVEVQVAEICSVSYVDVIELH
jgi:hypothetical protein